MDPQPQPEKLTPIEFVKAKLSLNPEATFAEIRAQAKIEGINVFPVVYGRAKALLGLVPTAAYGSKAKERRAGQAAAAVAAEPVPQPLPEPAPKLQADVGRIELEPLAAEESASAAAADERLDLVEPQPNPGRTARAKAAAKAAKNPAETLEGMIGELKQAISERDQYRALLTRLQEMIGQALQD